MNVHYRMNHCDERSCVHNRTQADSAAGTILRRSYVPKQHSELENHHSHFLNVG